MLFRLQLHSGTDVALFRSVAAALTYVALGLQFNPNYQQLEHQMLSMAKC